MWCDADDDDDDDDGGDDEDDEDEDDDGVEDGDWQGFSIILPRVKDKKNHKYVK